MVVSESEAIGAVEKFGTVEIVRPSVTILEQPPLAVVENNAGAHGVQREAEAYLRFLYSPAAQELIAKNHYRPVDPAGLAPHSADLPHLATFTVDDTFGGWGKANARFFADDGEYDRILETR